MAKLQKKSAAPKRRGPSPALVKAQARLENMKKRKKESKAVGAMTALTVLGAAAGLGYLQSQSKVPPTIFGFNAPLVVGAVATFGVPYFVGGTIGRVSSHVGLASLAVGGVQVGAGAPVMSGEWA